MARKPILDEPRCTVGVSKNKGSDGRGQFESCLEWDDTVTLSRC